MKRLFVSFYKKTLSKLISTAQVAILTQFEYRFNLFIDALLQPIVFSFCEIALWTSLFRNSQVQSIAGFSQAHYFSYALWASFISRFSANWMYESIMIDQVDSGSINSILVRPISFFQFYLGQFLGYKLLILLLSSPIIMIISSFFDHTCQWNRLPLAYLLLFYHLLFVYTSSICIASLAFFFNRIHSLSVTKHFLVWFLSGELFPLDLMPLSIKKFMIYQPFASGVYIPIAYLTGRIEYKLVLESFGVVTAGILTCLLIYTFLWQKGLKLYSGTGA